MVELAARTPTLVAAVAAGLRSSCCYSKQVLHPLHVALLLAATLLDELCLCHLFD
jgi:hypothetical protein